MHQKIPLPAIVAIVLLIVLVFIFATLDNDYDAIGQQNATTTIDGDTSAENADSVDGASEGANTAPEVTEVGSETVTVPVVTPLAPAPIAPEPVQPAPTADTSAPTVAPVSSHAAFMQCLADAGVVIYGSRTCPHARASRRNTEDTTR
jgi:cytoskeletal protein RodZ